MSYRLPIAVLSAFILGAGSVHAATITYQSRTITNGVNSSDYRLSWSAQKSAITTKTIPDFNNRLGGKNTFSHLSINFDSGVSNLDFQFAVDATYGGALYLDNKLLTKNTTDLWWAYNWKNTSEILSVKNQPLSFGNHSLDVFWAESCCNGSNSGRLMVTGTSPLGFDSSNNWQAFNLANLDALKPVPVPAAIWLFATGFLGLVASRRKAGKASPIAA